MTFGHVTGKLHVRDDSPVAKFLQLKSQFEYLIVSGELPPGRKLPSIREVAGALGVGPGTVVRAYRELEAAGLAVSSAGAGFFVIGAESARTEPHARIRERVTRLLEEAIGDGVAIEQVLQIFLAQVADMRMALVRPDIVSLCKRDGRGNELAMHLRHALADLAVEVTPLAIEDLQENLDGWLPQLTKARAVVSLLFDVKQARSLLGPHGIEVIPLLGALRDDARDRILHLPAGTRVGIVSVSVEFVDGMFTAVTGLNPTVDLVATCEASDGRGLKRLVREVDCIVFGTLARYAVEAVLRPSIESIEFIYIPDDSSVQRVRQFLRDRES